MKTLTLLLAATLLAGCAAPAARQDTRSPAYQRAKLHAELGSGYFAQGQMAVALEEFNEAIAIDPNHAPAYSGLGLVRASLRQYDMAEANFKKALALAPDSSEVRNNYGTFLCQRERVAESLEQFDAALANPLYATPELAALNAGICALKTQDRVRAELYFMRALQARPDMGQASYQLASLYYGRKQYEQARQHLAQAMRNLGDSPELLWLGVRVERALGGKDAEASYSMLLKNKFPDSEQTRAMLADRP